MNTNRQTGLLDLERQIISKRQMRIGCRGAHSRPGCSPHREQRWWRQQWRGLDCKWEGAPFCLISADKNGRKCVWTEVSVSLMSRQRQLHLPGWQCVLNIQPGLRPNTRRWDSTKMVKGSIDGWMDWNRDFLAWIRINWTGFNVVVARLHAPCFRAGWSCLSFAWGDENMSFQL